MNATTPDRRTLGILSVVGLAGACTMVLELSAVRLIAPWFGASQGVWTNVIGVVLLALALGYLAGARLAARARPERPLGWVLIAGALLTAWLPWAVAPVAAWLRPEGVTLDRAADLYLWGSLAAALVLFFPAATVLGCVCPLAVEIVQACGGLHAGTAGGRVLCVSTLGSLAGTFATTHLLLPDLGLRVTYLAGGIVLGGLGALVLGGALRRAGSAAALILVPAALLAPDGTRQPVGAGVRLLESAQSPYQALRVVETEGEGPLLRLLQVNEGLGSFQSVWQPEPGLLPLGYYYNAFALPPWWARAEGEWRLLVLGLGGGSAWRVVEGCLPPGATLASVGVEIDPAVVDLGRRHLDLPAGSAARRILAGWDARTALFQLAGERFDQVVLDTYANQTEIPAHLSSLEFFREVRGLLAEGGWLSVNVGGFGLEDPVVDAVARTAARAFGQRALLVRVPFARNVALIVRRGAAPPEPGAGAWLAGDRRVDSILARTAIPSAWRWVEPDTAGRVLTDDRNPIEELQRRSIRRAQEPG